MERLAPPRRFMTDSARSKGRDGEARAERLLLAQGYRVVERNVVVPGGEIDFVCVDGGTLVFVEVKRRDVASYGSALAGVDARKRRRLKAAAADYAQIAAPTARLRFDVVALDGAQAALHKNAF
jgi:putative endonuclease